MIDPIRTSAESAITEAAFIVLNRNPGASLAQVANVAGVGRATLHRHFSSREDLVRALTENALQEMIHVVEAACAGTTSAGEAVRLSLEVLIPLADRLGFVASDAITHAPEFQEQFEQMRLRAETLIAAAKVEGVFDKDIPTQWIVQAIDHLLYAAWKSVKAGEATEQQAADLAWRTLTCGLAK